MFSVRLDRVEVAFLARASQPLRGGAIERAVEEFGMKNLFSGGKNATTSRLPLLRTVKNALKAIGPSFGGPK